MATTAFCRFDVMPDSFTYSRFSVPCSLSMVLPAPSNMTEVYDSGTMSDVLSISVLCRMPNTVPSPAPATAKTTMTPVTRSTLAIEPSTLFFLRLRLRFPFWLWERLSRSGGLFADRLVFCISSIILLTPLFKLL